MLPLARAFLAAGHDVLWATGADSIPLVDRAGIPAVACGPSGPGLGQLRESVLGPASELPGAQRAAFVFPRMFGEALAPPMAADLVPLAREWAPDLLVHENGELASPLVGALLGVPSLTHAFGGAVPAPLLADAGERLATMWAEHGLEVPPYAGCFESLYLDICPTSVQAVPVDHIPDVQPLRPVVAVEADPSEPPLVYVTMGTVQNRALDLGPLVAAVAALPVEVLVAVGENGETDPGRPAGERARRGLGRPDSGALDRRGGGVPRRLRDVPRCPGPGRAPALPAAGGGPVPQRGGRRPGRGGTRPATGRDHAGGRRRRGGRLLDDGKIRAGAERVAAEIRAMPSPDDVVATLAERYA